MSSLKLFNTLTRTKEKIVPLQDNIIKMYTCGPTVYNFAHIGNFRTYVFEDLLRRTLKFFGFKVSQVMNLTDVDDKTINGALQKRVTLSAFTKPFKEAFFEDCRTLSIEPVEYYPEAVSFIPQMIQIITKLLEKGIAYKGADGSIYYSICHFPGYGKLSHLSLDSLKVGASNRIQTDEYDKENLSDFVLWKVYEPERDGDIFWESPFGKGRPGWHIECSAMAMALLGETIDIHVGGVDNMFPHHENEIAQSEAFSGKLFAKQWLHAEHLLVDHKKMSKSLGNFYTLRDLLNKGYSGREVRYMLLQGHYRLQLNFTFQELDAVRSALARMREFVLRMRRIHEKNSSGLVGPIIAKTHADFKEALADDLNISVALASLFDLMRTLNALSDQGKIGIAEVDTIFTFLKEVDQVLAIIPLEEEVEEIPPFAHRLLTQRQQARAQKNWPLADALRKELLEKGYAIEDLATGPRLKKI